MCLTRTHTAATVVSLVLVMGLAADTSTASAQYGGLGATVAAFYRSNSHGSSAPPVGVAYYKVIATKAGRVTAFRVETNFRPRAGNFQRLMLLGGVNLPADARPNQVSGTCMVWRSKTLKKLIGMEYAVGTTVTGTFSAELRGQRQPRC